MTKSFHRKFNYFTICTLVSMVFFIAFKSNAQTVELNASNNFSRLADSTMQANAGRERQDSARNGAKNRYVFRQLYGLVVRKSELKGKVIREFESSEKFLRYANKQIAEVRIIRLKAFGQSVYDTTATPTTLPEKIGNSLHVSTLKSVIENNLLFGEGDALEPVELSETEQILRELPYIEDANIVVETLTDTTKVRAIVITKDKWTLSLSLRMDDVDKGKAVISESNIGGIGLKALASGYYDDADPDKWGYKGELELTNIGGSFFTADLWRREGLGYNTYYANLNRNFYSSNAKYAGGATYLTSKEPYTMYSKDSIIPIDYNVMDWWIGRSFRVSRKRFGVAPYNLSFAFKYRKLDFDLTDSIAMDYNPYFHSTKQYLFSVGLTNQNLYQANLIYSFGSTEDIPIGFMVQLTSGIERSQYQRRIVVSGEMSAAEVTPLGYLYLSFRTGGYLAEKSRVEQAVVNIRSTYISNLLSVGRADIRQFVRYDFTRGISRFTGEKEYVALRNRYGVRGLKSNKLVGETRLMLNLETVVFSPLYVYGFRFAYFLFYDMGIVGPSEEFVYNNPIYSGIGLGLRIKNESLIFPTFLLRFGYYPNFPQDAEVANWLITTERTKRFEQFRVKEPYILSFE